MKLKLMRAAQSEYGTFGVLSVDETPLCVTCEDPWNNNKIGESCIPVGTYSCVPHSGEHFQNVWELLDVPDRSAILIHGGNTIKDTRGCILVGGGFGKLGTMPCITNSQLILSQLRNLLPGEFELTII